MFHVCLAVSTVLVTVTMISSNQHLKYGQHVVTPDAGINAVAETMTFLCATGDVTMACIIARSQCTAYTV